MKNSRIFRQKTLHTNIITYESLIITSDNITNSYNSIFLSESTCFQLEMEIETNSVVSDQHKKEAIKFDIQSSELNDTKKYIIAFLNGLLLHREKIDKSLLEAHVNLVITKLWQEVLSSLEDTNRKLINIQSGSLVFTLFCPTKNSVQQIQDEKWKIELQEKMRKLLKALGIF